MPVEPLEPVQGVARVAVQGMANNRPIVNVFHVANGATASGENYSAAGLQALVLGVKNAFVAQFVTNLNSLYTGSKVSGVDLSSIDGYAYDLAFTNSGSSPGALTPASVAACITWKVQRHYRGGHPRTYLGPLGSGAIGDPTSLAASMVSALNTAAAAFLAAINSLVCDGKNQIFVSVHRKYQLQKLLPPVVKPILSGTVDTRIDSQRRRLGKDR